MKLQSEQVEQFYNQGYLVVDNVLSEEELAPLIAAIEGYIDRRARELKAAGKIQDLCEGQPFEKRFAGLYAQSREIENDLDIYNSRLEEMYKFLYNEKLMDVVESLVGSEILCNPIQHLRAKIPTPIIAEGVPEYVHNVPWHQDAATMQEDADPYPVVTFWMPLVDAIKETGCMEVLPGAFRAGLLPHQNYAGLTIIPAELPEIKPQAVPCKKGGLVIMSKYTPHRGLPNKSDIVRWSLDLRYQPAGTSTGRSFYPEFIARSRQHPEQVRPDYVQWCADWIVALEAARNIKKYRSSILV
jgi:phytanoyl-CoA hydroxylase